MLVRNRSVGPLRGVTEPIVPLPDRGVRQGSIITPRLEVDFDLFQTTKAGLQMTVTPPSDVAIAVCIQAPARDGWICLQKHLLVELWPTGDAATRLSQVDQIPGFFS